MIDRDSRRCLSDAVVERSASRISPNAIAAYLRITGLIERAKQPQDECLSGVWTTPEGLSEREAGIRLRMHGPNESVKFRDQYLATRLTPLAPWLGIPMFVMSMLFFGTGYSGAAPMVFIGGLMTTLLIGVLGRPRSDVRRRPRKTFDKRVMVKRVRGAPISPINKHIVSAVAINESSELFEIPQRNLVIGDIVLLSGDARTCQIIPADVRLLSASDFFVDQGWLTGDSSLVAKRAETPNGSMNHPAELPNICFKGSRIFSGRATAVVLTTGSKTLFARSHG